MTDAGYEIFEDPYCYRGTFVLKNKAGLRDAEALEAFELEMSTLRAEEPLPRGRFGPSHYRAIHRHLFGDSYFCAGRYRTARTSKGGNLFCYPEHIDAEVTRLFARTRSAPFTGGGDAAAIVEASAAFLAELNAIHPFREGNGRAQLAFMCALLIRAGRPLDMTRLGAGRFCARWLRASKASFRCSDVSLGASSEGARFRPPVGAHVIS